jgi:prepilin-type N-terminal cleavage/methylation domain-containing protein
MKSRKGFTLIELMIVVVIVGILAAIIIPLLLSRVERAKYSEGKAIAGQIATAVRAYAAEQGNSATLKGAPDLVTDLGFKQQELDGKYFYQTNMAVSNVAVSANGQVSYVISLTPNATAGITTALVLTCDATSTTVPYDPTFTVGGIEY